MRIARANRSSRTFVCCFLATLVEGYDLQSAGVLAPKFAPYLHLDPRQVGWVFTSSLIGLLVGACGGGWLADRIGRKSVLVGSMTLFGLFTLGTALSNSFDMFWVMRLLTGLGLGGAMPNVIALVAEASAPAERATRVTYLVAGMPIGGVLVVCMVLFGPQNIAWQLVFGVGGWAPLILAPLLLVALPESESFVRARQLMKSTGRPNTGIVLFGQRRAISTLLIWTTFFVTQMVLYVMLNWLPSLMVANGFSHKLAALASFAFGLGTVAGGLILGLVTKRINYRVLFVITFGATAVGLIAMALAGGSLALILLAVFAVGFFIIGCQFLLYGVSPGIYPVQLRATGLGWAIGIGRIGAIVGPALAGFILAGGGESPQVLLAMLPGLAIGMATGLALSHKSRQVMD
jgi:MFS transporter, AAHS family, 3-hydroxyphenylpropionic acid transporter